MLSDTSVDDDLLARVRALRNAGRTSKEIGRVLGLRPSAVNPLVRSIAQQAADAETEPALVGCWVSPGWRRHLGSDRHDWTDVTADDCSAGLVGVVVARRHRTHRVSVGGYLVDTFCLGVKNALGPEVMSEPDLPAFLSRFFAAFDDHAARLEAPLELARHLVWGAVDYARQLGFEPHPDFATVAGHLGEWNEASAIRFGRDGVPFYMSGPHDNSNAVLRTLNRTIGGGNFHFVTAV